MPRRKQKLKYTRKKACKYLTPKGDISNTLQPLCFCPERDLVLAPKAYVCQVCHLYSQVDKKFAEVYEESKKEAEKKIKERELEVEELELGEIKEEEEIDLSVEEFEEEEEVSERFEQKATQSLEDVEEFTEAECPFCGELFDDLTTHIKTCEFAPEDASIEDLMPAKTPRKKKEKKEKKKKEKDTIDCPYCGKEYVRLSRHLPYCDDRPENPDEEKEDLYMDGKIDLEEFKE
ncbi:MAG: hypothetical protein BAJALOKI2v1_260016 [Promethearchaeota archaeon]|nr:MAG: hypothetical protein BAJALOKI2v1_260016 [Candidatus Lokiarchaeota archaeon]